MTGCLKCPYCDCGPVHPEPLGNGKYVCLVCARIFSTPRAVPSKA